MGAFLDRFRSAGVSVAALPDGRLRATGALTDPIRATIREHKSAILAELAANDAAPAATPEQVAELRELVAIVAADWPDGERTEALAVALADPDAALTCFQALVADRQEAPPARVADDGMRTCTRCANLAPSGRCLAAWRGESFGVGVAVSRRYSPTRGWPQRCGPFVPLPGDPDRRTGRERWSFLFRPPLTAAKAWGPRGQGG